MNTEKFFKLLVFGLNNFNSITSVDRYTEETGHCRVTWYNNDKINFSVDEENGCIDITSDKGIISIWKDELISILVEGGNYSQITVKTDNKEYVIYER